MKNPVVSSRIPEKLIRQVDRYAKRNNVTRSMAVAGLIALALEIIALRKG